MYGHLKLHLQSLSYLLNFSHSGPVGSVKINLLDQFHIREKRDEGDKIGIRHLVPIS